MTVNRVKAAAAKARAKKTSTPVPQAAAVVEPVATVEPVAPVAPKDPPARRIIDVPQLPQINVQMPKLPRPHIPDSFFRWILMGAALFIFYYSAVATDFCIKQIFGSDMTFWWAICVQCVFFAVERHLFGGYRHPWAIGILLVDAAINAIAFFAKLLPSFFESSLWAFASALSGLTTPTEPRSVALVALFAGALLAYSGDKLFHMATG